MAFPVCPPSLACPTLAWTTLALLLLGHNLVQARDDTRPLLGAWRFTHALAAPWGPALAGSPDLGGRMLHLTHKGMTGPAPLNCDRARLETTTYPAEGLFQGNLPPPAPGLATALGLGRLPVPGLRVSCEAGVFEFHQADATTLLLGLDNRVWTLSRAPGALAPHTSAAGRVEQFLEVHFSGAMGFDEETARARQAFQSRRLNQLIDTYLGRPRPGDQVPPINGDPYTDSQEYPTRFAVGTTRSRGDRARVPVTFSDAGRQRTVTFELVRESGTWQVDDLDYGHGERFSVLLTY